uniref:RNA-dependent RNA polymerase n=1 Tax=Blueberry mosaic associated virus TaxID=1520332 RepID=A0A182C1R2_9VIRU|nr:RNA-dependent RNA polymerase [Blueberry mosaic associated virus]
MSSKLRKSWGERVEDMEEMDFSDDDALATMSEIEQVEEKSVDMRDPNYMKMMFELAEEKYSDLMKRAEKYKSFSELMAKYGKQYCDLMMSRLEEEQKEPPKTIVDYSQGYIYMDNWTMSDYHRNYVDKPSVITKLNQPYRTFSKSVVDMISEDGKFPEKFSSKAKIELFRAREFIKEFCQNKNLISSQNEVFKFYNYLKSFQHQSKYSEECLNFGSALENLETNRISLNLLNKKIRTEAQKIECTIDTLNDMWILNLIETINLKIKMSYSMLNKKYDGKESVTFHENRRINTRCNNDGSSVTKIEIQDYNEEIEIFLFFSNSFSVLVYGDKALIGNGDMMNYLLSIADHNVNLSIISELKEQEVKDTISPETKFIRYIKSLSVLPTKLRVGLAGLYESTCLLMADYRTKSSVLPLIDNLVDSAELSLGKTDEIIQICLSVKPEDCIKMSCIGKTIIYAEIDTKKGLEKYTQRTDRNHPIDPSVVEKLRLIFRMKVVTSYISKYGVVPQLQEVSDLLSQELSLMAAKGSYSRDIVYNPFNYKNFRLGKMLELGQETNISSRVIDKACSKDEYDEKGNSVKELIYYIENNNLDDLIEEVYLDRKEFDKDRTVQVLPRKHKLLKECKKYMLVRLVEKEKELKPAARFFGVASFKIKLYVSTVMELVKRAMKLIPGQMMTMTEDERRSIMYKMSSMLEEKDSYSIFLDYSGHNTSQRPGNNAFILEEICDMYGFTEGSREREHVINVLYIFSNMEAIYESSLSDFVYKSNYQNGAIEGWLGPLWGIQSQLMMEDMLSSLGFKRYIGTTYSDDSCGVFIEKDLNNEKLDDIIMRIQWYAERMGLLVKLSQTQVTNGRCSMLKNHYFKDLPIENNYKRMMAISPNSSVIWGDELEQVKNIDSGYTSSCSRSNHHKFQTIIKNYRMVMLLSREIMRFGKFMEIELDKRFMSHVNAEQTLNKICMKSSEYVKMNYHLIPNEEDMLVHYLRYNNKNEDLLECTLILFYLPFTMFGYATTSIPDASLSGYSVSNVKRICYVESLISKKNRVIKTYNLSKLSKNAYSYISTPFPMEGGRFDTGTLLKDVLKQELPRRIINEELKTIHKVKMSIEEEQFKAELVSTFRDVFSHRIVSKFYECSIFNYFEEIYSKIDNSTTFTFILGKLKMNKLWNKAWTINHKIEFKEQSSNLYSSYNEMIDVRSSLELEYKLRGNIYHIKLNFLEIEEVPLLGKVTTKSDFTSIQPILRINDYWSDVKTKRAPPLKTNINSTKFDRDLEIEGMFQNKLIFLAYELVRYVKWIIMDMEKYSSCSEDTKQSLYEIANVTLSTFSNASFSDLSEYVVAPKGGRYFHRANAGGFNPKTGDLSSNEETSKYEIAGIDKLIESTGGIDNNLNLQYLMLSIKASLAYLKPKQYELKPLSLCQDVALVLRDVSFSLDGIKSRHKMTRFEPCKIVNDLSSIKNKSKLYKSFSYFISTDDSITGKFINHSSIVPNEVIMRYSSFKSVYKYMEDQEILSPEVIPDEVLMRLAPEIVDYGSRDQYFDAFYKFYQGLNIIDNETPTRSVIRSLIYSEVFRKDKDGNSWAKDICEKGYSLNYRNALLKLFIVTTSLVYRLEEKKPSEFTITMNRSRTLANSIINFKRMKNNTAHFYVKDKRISELLMLAFPTTGYKLSEIHKAVEEVNEELDGKRFHQYQMNTYYEKDIKDYLNPEDEIFKCAGVKYEEIEISEKEFMDKKTLGAAIKAFEMICSMNCKPRNVSSPTMSDIYPSIDSVLDLLTKRGFISEGDEIADIFAGRGDCHLAMMKKGIKHASISRNDGYNLLYRVRGMTEVKTSIDMVKKENYTQYLDRDIFLLDISHFSGKDSDLLSMITDIVNFGKKMIIRLNSVIKIFSPELSLALQSRDLSIMIPSIESPGYLYLIVDDVKRRKSLTGAKGSSFTNSLLTEKLTNEIIHMRPVSLFNKEPEEVKDHTMEAISDRKLINILLDSDPDYVELPQCLEEEIKSKDDLEKILFTPLPTGVDIERNNFLHKLIDEEKLKMYYPRLLVSDSSERMSYRKIWKVVKDKNFPKEIIINHEIERKVSDGFVIGFENISEDELFQLIRIMITSNKTNSDTEMAWRFILKLCSTTDVRRTFSSMEIIENLNLAKLQPDKMRSIDKIYNIAHIAGTAYRSSKVDEGLMILSGMKSTTLAELMKNKSKERRYNCLNYKLIINRMRLLHRKLNLNIQRYGYNIPQLVDKFSKYERVVNDVEKERMVKFIQSFETMEEYFATLSSNELFDAIISGIKEEKVIENSIGVIEASSSNMSTFIEKFIGTSEEEIERNKNMTQEELESFLEEMSDIESDLEE